MALGAMGRDLLGLVLGNGMKMAGYGIALGAVAVGGSAWLLVHSRQVQNVSWTPFAYSIAVIVGVTTAASLGPAWRVARFTPMMAIRNDKP